jgi:histidinol-phosphate aminotransferase
VRPPPGNPLIRADELVLPAVAALHPYEPGKPIEEVQRELGIGEPAKLASNENPVGPSPMAVAAIRASLGDLNRYPDGSSWTLRHKIAAKHQVSPDRIFLGSGSCEILNLLVYLFLRPGFNAVIAEHSFVIYQLAIAASGGAAKAVPLREDCAFDLDAMAAAIDEHTRLVFLGNPNNPTGTIYRKAEWRRFLERVPERVVIVADEAYFEFVRDPEYPDSMRDHDDRRMLVTLRTFSKIFGLAGLRVGYSVAREDITRLLNNVRQPFNITSLGQVAVEAGMDDIEHVRRTLEVNARGMDYLEREFRRLGLGFLPSQANFILVEVGEGRGVYEDLLRQGVIVRPMNGYGFPRHVRVSVGLENENRRMIAALERTLAHRGAPS